MRFCALGSAGLREPAGLCLSLRIREMGGFSQSEPVVQSSGAASAAASASGSTLA